MLIIKHRINTSNNLKKVIKDFGVAIDVRSHKYEIYLLHLSHFESICLYWPGLHTKCHHLRQWNRKQSDRR